jgi:hypothetical protein
VGREEPSGVKQETIGTVTRNGYRKHVARDTHTDI